MEFAPGLRRVLCLLRSLYRPAIQTIDVIYFKFTYFDTGKKAGAGVVIFIWPVIALIGQGFFLSRKCRLIEIFRQGSLGCGEAKRKSHQETRVSMDVRSQYKPAQHPANRDCKSVSESFERLLGCFPPACPRLERSSSTGEL